MWFKFTMKANTNIWYISLKVVNKMENLLETSLEIATKKTNDYFFINDHRLKQTAFTRERSLSFQKVIFMKLDTIKQSNNTAIYNILKDVYDQQPVARQTFEEARNNISHTAFKEIFNDTVNNMLSVPDMNLFKGYRVIAIDGSTNALPKSKELKEVFGKSTPVEGEIYCRISICADVLNEFIIEGEIAGFDVGERKLAQKHIEKINCENPLFLGDRGYWSPEIIRNICGNGKKFLFRIASNGVSAVTKSEESDGVFEYKGDILRFHKFKLKNGEIEYLVTNLDNNEITNSELEELYALRWGVETRYNELKNQVGLMRFSGKSELVVLQDFYASLTVMNYIASAIYDANKLVFDKRKDKSLKHKYKANKTSAINILKIRYLKAALESDPQKKNRLFKQLAEDIARTVVPIRPGRHFQRRIYTGKKRISNR